MTDSARNTIGQAIDLAMSALATLEKREQQIVISTICSLLDITDSVSGVGLASTHAGVTDGASAVPFSTTGSVKHTDSNDNVRKGEHSQADDDRDIDIRTLRNQKQPSSVQQMACIVAYYLQEHAPKDERSKEVTTADLERLFKQAGYKLPSRMEQVLVNAKIAGYFESVDRGKYRLTRVGYNLVTHSLPKATAT
jgi:hypothetical protein